MQLRIRSITYLADGVLGFELTDPNAHDLPRFTAGAHVAVRVAPGLLRVLWRQGFRLVEIMAEKKLEGVHRTIALFDDGRIVVEMEHQKLLERGIQLRDLSAEAGQGRSPLRRKVRLDTFKWEI